MNLQQPFGKDRPMETKVEDHLRQVLDVHAAANANPVNLDGVAHLLQEGLKYLQEGKNETAWEFFLGALLNAGPADDLRATCLINLADWVSQIAHDAKAASGVLEIAHGLIMTPATQSRYYLSQAMIYLIKPSNRDLQPDEWNAALELLQQALNMAQVAQLSQLAEGEAAELLIVHWLAKVTAAYGTPKQQRELTATIDALIPRTENPAAGARLKYDLALCLSGHDKPKAISIILEACESEKISRLTAAMYAAQAGLWFYDLPNRDRAEECLALADLYLPTNLPVNATQTVELIERLRSKLA